MQQPAFEASFQSPQIVIIAPSSTLSSPIEMLVGGASEGDTLVRPDFLLSDMSPEVARQFEEKKLRFAELDFRLLVFGRVDLFAQQLATLMQSCNGNVRLLLPGAWRMLPKMRVEEFARIISEACGTKIVLC